ncbi:ATP-dependent DNA helicase [Pseudemcibacter aquimaris]|uniref:ATP-dependent DNA helicase n=1 Tax=Pseudemcibacter aquimaris TaxID=2857064 RepID=UPI002012F5D7|nr:AAA family ATPase [Pseudemcibacter aquimaris]MCC3862614.1 AAA family ATPase [Pseudemcibacter aquimaris]WDU57839.1 AAA family ATPase [Pseudemcibacter aquimaris]
MKIDNFKPLKVRWPQLYEYAHHAEQYVHSDPHTAIIKLRCFAEQLVGTLYRELNLPCDRNDAFFEKLTAKACVEVVDEAILQKLHTIRILGNKAAHGEQVETDGALSLLYDAYVIGQWIFKTYSGSFEEQYPAFEEPLPPSNVGDALLEKNKLLNSQLEDVKAELAQLQKSELEAQIKNRELQHSLNEAELQRFKNASTRAIETIDTRSHPYQNDIDLKDIFASYTLTNDQQKLVSRLESFLNGSNEKLFLLQGYAGTGKTFITKGLTEYFRAIGRNFVLAAPTGKASKVIADKTKCQASTIHKAIYSFKDISEYREDGLDGSQTYKYYAQLAVNDHSADTVFIVDEASMVSDIYSEEEFFRFGSGYLLQDFMDFVNLDHNDHNKKVIFIGDNAQLPPVGMKYSPALNPQHLQKKYNKISLSFELREVVRQKADSGVIANSIKLRDSIDKSVFNQLDFNCEYPDIKEVDYSDLISCYLDSCNAKINAESIILAHSNADVAAYNRRVREHFFPEQSDIASGDKVMAVSNNYAYGVDIFNGDFGLIREVLGSPETRTQVIKRKNSETDVVEEIEVPITFRNVNIGFKDLDGRAHFFNAKVVENLIYSDHPSLTSDENKALYLDFCIRNPKLKPNTLEFKEALRSDLYFNALRVKFGYAITCHKAQGSEWNNVFVKCRTHQSQLTSDYFRWIYTAITRTKQNLFLLDPPKIKIGSGIKVVSSPNSHREIPEATVLNTHKTNQTQNSFTATEPLYGIPPNAHFSNNLLKRVQATIKDKSETIQDIELKQYQDIYFFKNDDDAARIDIRYNGKQKITAITTPKQTAFSLELLEMLSPLKGEIILAASEPQNELMDFGEDFLNAFHERLSPIASENGLIISSVEPLDWNQRYHFTSGNERAVVDIFYNGKKQFTKCALVKTACTSTAFSNSVLKLIMEELG